MRLMTYNIHKGIGGHDRRYSLRRVIEVIEHENPDLLLLQEVTHLFHRCGGDDQTSLLCTQFLAVDSMYQQNVRLKTGGYGNLLISRWPIVEKHSISLQQGKKKNRGAQPDPAIAKAAAIKAVWTHRPTIIAEWDALALRASTPLSRVADAAPICSL